METNEVNPVDPTEVKEKECVSSMIAFIRFDHSTNTLQVEFKNGKKYNYAEVPLEVWAEALAAESIGTFFNKNIKGKFVGALIEEPLI